MYIDVHCHLDLTTYGDLEQLIDKFNSCGIAKVITVGFDLPSSYMARDIAERFPTVYFTAGFHPTELSKYREGDLGEIEKLLSHPKCVALGEIGLDYHYPDTNKPLQRDIFVRQLEMAARLNMPVQIHSRDCAEDMLAILREHKSLLKSGALLHCYSHSTEMAPYFAELGLYFSFGGASTWKGSKKARRTIALLDKDRLLTETDSPYMPPQSIYGTFPNSSLSIPEILKSMSEAKGVAEGELELTVWQNAHTLFKKLN